MAVRMRLTRVGSKKNPIYRVVVADQRSPRDGRFIEIIGRYNPQTEPSTIDLDEAKVTEQLGHYALMPAALISLATASEGCAPLPSHSVTFASSRSIVEGSVCGL